MEKINKAVETLESLQKKYAIETEELEESMKYFHDIQNLSEEKIDSFYDDEYEQKCIKKYD